MAMQRTLVISACAVLGLAASTHAQPPAGTAFTYQGRLEDAGSPATGSYDFEFRLFAASSGGTQVGTTVARQGVVVAAGLFTVDLDFGDGVFTGDALWLELAVRPAGGGTFITLGPRQRTTAAPYAIHALSIPLAGSGSAATAARSDHDHDGAYAPTAHDHVGQAWTTDSAVYGLTVTNSSSVASGAALRGVHSGTSGASYAVQGINTQEVSGAIGVMGLAAGSSGTTYGVYGLVGSASGWGLFTPNDASVGGSLSLGSASTPAARLDVSGQGRFVTGSGMPPLLVPTAYAPGATVLNLSSDRLDGLDSSAFSTSVHTHDAADLASGTIASARVSGAYGGITGVGTLGTGTWSASPIGPLFGGTGQTGWATGDLLFASASNTLARLPVGTTGQVLSVSSGLPAWTAAGNHDHLGQTWMTSSDFNALNVVNNNATTGGTAIRGAYGGTGSVGGVAINGVNLQSALGATAVRGEATDVSALNFGVYGQSSSSNGRGIAGIASATSGQPVGVFGQAGSPTGWGFFTSNNSYVGGSLRVGLSGQPSARLDVVGQARIEAASAAPPLIVPTAYAAGANVTNLSADRLDGLDSSDFAPDVHNHVGEQWTATTGSAGLSVTSTSPTTGGALRGTHTGTGSPSWGVEGVNGQSLAGAAGVFGYTTNSSFVNYGVLGRSQSTQGIGVKGEASVTTGNAWGVYGFSASSLGRGVVGQVTATSGPTFGVYGDVTSPDGFGLYTPDRAYVGSDLFVDGGSSIASGLGVGGNMLVSGDTNGLARLTVVPSTTPGVREVEFATGGDVEIVANSNMRIGTNSTWNLELQTTGNTRMTVTAAGNVGIGTVDDSVRLGVARSGAAVAEFNRTTNDGAVVLIAQDGIAEGNISVSGTTVSYNAFTGSHYAWTDETMERGMLVSMTGDNRRLHDREGAEAIYGIATAMRANDSAVLGAYLGRLEPSQPERPQTENPHLVAAVGNGELWVVEAGGDIEPGDALVASAVPGHAMRDDDRFEVSHVVARAAERVRWRDVTDRRDGARRRLISVLFEGHVREGTSALRAALDRSTRELTELRAFVAAQSSRLEVLEAALTGGERGRRRVATGPSTTDGR